EHFVEVEHRSSTKGQAMSLGFTASARPADAGMLGAIPDALFPTNRAPAWAPYPLAVAPRERAVLFAESFILAAQAEGRTTRHVRVRKAGETLADLVV